MTNINTFDNKNIDIEKVSSDKTIYNIYNNSVKEPLYNFYFLADNCKYNIMVFDKKHVILCIISLYFIYLKYFLYTV